MKFLLGLLIGIVLGILGLVSAVALFLAGAYVGGEMNKDEDTIVTDDDTAEKVNQPT